MRHRVDEAQLAVLDAEEVGIRCTAAARGIAGAERAERYGSADRFIDYEVAVQRC